MTPTPKRSECGCKVESRFDKPYIKETIRYCPLHLAAPRLLEALEGMVEAWGGDPTAWKEKKEVAVALLREVRGK